MNEQQGIDYIRVDHPRWKYQLTKPYVHKIGRWCWADYDSPFIGVDYPDVIIKVGYAWDGPSGPTFDTKSFMRGSLLHDALYQLMREGVIVARYYRKRADELLREICLEDGMWSVRAWWVYQSVRMFGKGSARASV